MASKKTEDKEEQKEKEETPREMQRQGRITNFHVIQDGDTAYVTIEAQFDNDEKHISTIYHVLPSKELDEELVQLGSVVDIYYTLPATK